MHRRYHHPEEGPVQSGDAKLQEGLSRCRIVEERLGLRGRIRKLMIDGALWIVRRAARVQAKCGSETNDQEILDRMASILSRFPAWLRRLLESNQANELFATLEGKRVDDVGGIAEALGELQDIEKRRRTVREVGRNDPCPCNSGKKYKKCCGHPS